MSDFPATNKAGKLHNRAKQTTPRSRKMSDI